MCDENGHFSASSTVKGIFIRTVTEGVPLETVERSLCYSIKTSSGTKFTPCKNRSNQVNKSTNK